ncbi:MAG: 30S ribosomal protein S13 [Patescibacteria group bacterium]
MRLAGITLPDNKRIEIALTAIYGIGRGLAQKILDEAKVDYSKTPPQITDAEDSRIRKIVETQKVEGVLKREVAGNIKRLIDIKSYRGSRHQRHLPSRGQRTKTNSRTRRGNIRKTMGSGRKKVEKK